MRKQPLFVALLSASLLVACGGPEPTGTSDPVADPEGVEELDEDPDAVLDPEPEDEEDPETEVITEPDPVDELDPEEPTDPEEEEPVIVVDPPEELDRPVIVDTLPADGITGFDAFGDIVINFDRQMKSYFVEEAFSSETLPDVEFTWTNGEKTLTITPLEPLNNAFGFGLDPDALAYKTYDFTIAGTARDIDDIEMGEDITVSFSTRKKLVGSLPVIHELTRTRLSNGTTHSSGNGTLYVGDSNAGAELQLQTFLSFDMTDLPVDAEVQVATLVAEQTEVNNTPFVDLGELNVEHVSFNEVDDDAFTKDAHGLAGVLSNSEALGARALDVTDAVASDHGARWALGDETQFRLCFDEAFDDDNVGDSVELSRESLKLAVTYWVD